MRPHAVTSQGRQTPLSLHRRTFPHAGDRARSYLPPAGMHHPWPRRSPHHRSGSRAVSSQMIAADCGKSGQNPQCERLMMREWVQSLLTRLQATRNNSITLQVLQPSSFALPLQRVTRNSTVKVVGSPRIPLLNTALSWAYRSRSLSYLEAVRCHRRFDQRARLITRWSHRPGWLRRWSVIRDNICAVSWPICLIWRGEFAAHE